MFIPPEIEHHLKNSRIARSITLVLVAVVFFMVSLTAALWGDRTREPVADQGQPGVVDRGDQTFVGTITEISADKSMFQVFVSAEKKVFTVMGTEHLGYELQPGAPVSIQGTIDREDDGTIHARSVNVAEHKDERGFPGALIEVVAEDISIE